MESGPAAGRMVEAVVNVRKGAISKTPSRSTSFLEDPVAKSSRHAYPQNMPIPHPQPQPKPDPDGRPGPHDPRPDPAPQPKKDLPPNLAMSDFLGEPMLAVIPVERVTRTFTRNAALGDTGFIKTGGGSLHE